jgi:DNA end-binding protein Ku
MATKTIAARSMWSGSISFGLVNIPVKLYTAVREHRISFHMLHDQDKVRLRRKLICPADDKEVHPEHIVKGYEIAKDQYIIVRKDELEGCAPDKTRAIEITDFVGLDEIDPIYFDRPYYIMPQAGAAKSYALLVEAMSKSKKVGIARFVLHDKEYLTALRPVGKIICMETMHFGDEIVDSGSLGAVSDAKVGEREMKIAQQLIDSLTTTFDADNYHDEYSDCVREMLEKKAEGEEIVIQPPPDKQKSARATDLMAALEASLARTRQASGRGTKSSGNSEGNGNGHGNGHSARGRRRARS